MLGKTHFVLGMASAMVITHPQTVPGVISAMTGGAIGGWIVDIDIKNRDLKRSEDKEQENIFDAIIDALFILAFIVVDFFTGKGMCQYVIDNWGVKIWGALFGILILFLIGLNTKHRTFTHSFLAMALFSGLVYLFCRPATFPFLVGYASHLVSDFFNKKELKLFFPLRWKKCLNLCSSDGKANQILFWISLTVDITLGAFLFSKAMRGVDQSSTFIANVTEKRFFGLNLFQCYLIFINLLTFAGFQRKRNYRIIRPKEITRTTFQRDEILWGTYVKGQAFKDQVYKTPESKFEVGLLNILVFLGGGVGMLVSLVINRELPVAYNGNWWAFCYSSILFWFTVYCYICNPFGYKTDKIAWLSTKHIPLLVYLVGINAVSALSLYTFRKKKFKPTDIKHTLVFLLGALGGTVGAISTVFAINRQGDFHYVVFGFFVMLISQIVFIMYMMSAAVF